MNKFWMLTVSIILLWQSKTYTQPSQKPARGYTPASANIIYASSFIPVGIFAQSHYLGFATGYHKNKSLRTKKTTLLYGIDASVVLGKKEMTSGYAYKYPAYFFTAIIAGPSYQFTSKINGCIALGPGFSLYNSKSHFSINGKSMVQYTLNKKIALGISGTALQTLKTKILLGTGAQIVFFL
jgi:hypothetical protein